MPSLEQMKPFLNDYQRYVEDVLIPTRNEIERLFALWHSPSPWERFSQSTIMPIPSPVHSTKVRIKRAESVIDKILRRPDVFPDGLSLKSLHTMSDAIGGRVIVYFLNNLSLLDSVIQNNELLEISSSKAPVAYMDSELSARLALNHLHQVRGLEYAAVHYLVRFRNAYLPVRDQPWFELQVLTLTQQTGRDLVNLLGYKPDQRTSFAVRKQFQIVNRLLVAVDEHFNFVSEELTRFQHEAEYTETDLLNAEILPRELAIIGVKPSQSEIDGLLKLLISRGISTVRDLRKIASPRALALIHQAYSMAGTRRPTSFEMVASLAIVKENADDSKIIEEIKTQIAFLEIWEELKSKP